MDAANTYGVNEIADCLRHARFNFNSEAELQSGVQRFLSAKYTVQAEVELSRMDRIDFLIGGIGIELKVDGSRADVIRQLHRYAQSDRIEALILVTSRTRHNDMPETINGKPLRVISLVLERAF